MSVVENKPRTAGSNSTVDWSAQIFSEDWMKRLDKMAAKRFGEGGLAEEATTYVIEHISANDWEKCRSFKGQSNPKTFLYTLASNFIEEFARKRFGRPRPPTWLQRQGDLWVSLWRKICLERQNPLAVADGYYADDSNVEKVGEVIRTIKARIPTCGQATMEVAENAPQGDDEDRVTEIEDTCLPEFEHVGFDFEVGVYGEMILMLKALLVDEVSEANFEQPALLEAADIASANREKLLALREQIQMNNQERLILRMIYQDGLSKTAASKALGLPGHQAGRIVTNVMARIGEAFKACGVELESIINII